MLLHCHSNVSRSHFLHKITLFERGQTACLITTEPSIVDLFSALEIKIQNGRYIEAALAPLWLEAKVIPYN